MTSAKYLGVTITKDLNWDEHINNQCSKANKTLKFLRRNLKISSTGIKEKAYKALVRPHLEYASSVWDPHTDKNINKIEGVQRRAARFALNRYRNTSSVGSMLNTLGWPSLRKRRQTARLSMLYKILNGIVHCNLKEKLIPLPERKRRGHNKQFRLIPARTQYRAASFLPKTIQNWNNLPHEGVEATTNDTFVSLLSEQISD